MGNKKDELLDLAQRQINAAQDADMAALDAANERELADQMETEALAASHKTETEGLANYNKAQYANMGQILSDVQGKIDEAKQKDETARRRENAFRYISGLGDTLSGVANLIGTGHGAANQNQTYNSHAVVQKAEAARKARKLEMDELSKRLDEMTARQREMQAAGSLKEVELKARHDKEKAALAATQRKAADEAKYKERRLRVDEQNAKAAMIRAEAYEYGKENPTPKTTKPRVVKVMGADGKMKDLDVAKFENFDADYQKALDASIADGSSGLSNEEIEAYQKAVKLAKADSDNALKEFLRTHTYRQSVIDRMSGTGANNPKYQ